MEQQETQKQSGAGGDGSVVNSRQVAGEEGQQQDEKPEGIHSDAPVSLHNEVEKQDGAQDIASVNRDTGVFLGLKKGKAHVDKQQKDAGVGDGAVVVAR
jgi:hypothetical protein